MLPTVQLSEVIWVLVATPGAYLWWVNLITSKAERRALLNGPASTAGRIFANYQVSSARVMLGIEIIFLFMGGLAMSIPANPSSSFLTRWGFATLLIIASCLITYRGFQWRGVDRAIRRALEQANGNSS